MICDGGHQYRCVRSGTQKPKPSVGGERTAEGRRLTTVAAVAGGSEALAAAGGSDGVAVASLDNRRKGRSSAIGRRGGAKGGEAGGGRGVLSQISGIYSQCRHRRGNTTVRSGGTVKTISGQIVDLSSVGGEALRHERPTNANAERGATVGHQRLGGGGSATASALCCPSSLSGSSSGRCSKDGALALEDNVRRGSVDGADRSGGEVDERAQNNLLVIVKSQRGANVAAERGAAEHRLRDERCGPRAHTRHRGECFT